MKGDRRKRSLQGGETFQSRFNIVFFEDIENSIEYYNQEVVANQRGLEHSCVEVLGIEIMSSTANCYILI